MTLGQKVLLFLQNRVFRSIVFIFCLVLAVGVVRSIMTIWQKREIVAERKLVLKAEEAKKRELEHQLQEATSAAFVERAAREKLGLVREGESVVIMNQAQASTSGNQETSDEVPSWQQWWKLFF